MVLAHKIALDPTPSQCIALAKACGCARVAYNWGLATAIDLWDNTGRLPSGYDLRKQFNAIKGELYPWIYESPASANQEPFRNLQKAFSKAFDDKKAGKGWHPPKFKKKGRHDSFYTANWGVSLGEKAIYLSVIGWVKTREDLRFEGKIMSATVSRTANRWFVSVAVEMPDYHKPRVAEGIIGIDLGLKSTIVTSGGQVFQAPKALKQNLEKLQKYQRRFSKKQPGSANRKKAQKKLARLHKRIADIRSDFTHKTTTELVRQNKTIVIEDLNVKGMMKNQRLARALSDVGFGEIRRQLTYKSRIYGTNLRVTPRFFPSSKTCSNCGHVKTKLALSERTFTCEVCGVQLDRDLNAALNIKAVGLTVTVCGPPYREEPLASSNRAGTKQKLKTRGMSR